MINESLIKFSQLPSDIRMKISSPQFLVVLDNLEERYNIKLSTVLIMVIVGDLKRDEIDKYLIENFQLGNLEAKKVKMEVYDRVLKLFPPFYFLDFYIEQEKPEIKAETLPESNEILKAYAGGEDVQKAIGEEENVLKDACGNDSKKIWEEFFKAVQNANSYRVCAALKLLAAAGELNKFLKEDEKLKKFLALIWEKKYGKAVADEYQKSPDAPKFVTMFLRYVFEERLKMKEGDAARIGAQMGSLYKKQGKSEYSRMAYFDMEAKEFRWLE